MAKQNNSHYEWEYTVAGFIPSTRLNDHTNGGERSEKVTAYKTLLSEEAKRLIAERGESDKYPVAKDRFIVTVVQFSPNQTRLDSCDVDNFGKTILDALKGVIYENDAQVYVFLSSKVYVQNYRDIAYIGVKRIPANTAYPTLLKEAGVENARVKADAFKKHLDKMKEEILPNEDESL